MFQNPHDRTRIKPKDVLFVALVLAAIVLAMVYIPMAWYAIDYQAYFAPAALSPNPFTIPGFYNPPWTVFAILPFALVSARLGQALFFTCSLVALIAICYRVGLNWWKTVLACTSVPGVYILVYGNLEWFALLGLLLPRPVGMILLAIKPQVTFGIMALWIAEAIRDKKLLGLLSPLIWTFLCSVLLWGWWPPYMLAAPHGVDAEIWPWGILLGIWALSQGRGGQFLTGPCLSPHLTKGSWFGVFLFLANWPLVMALAWVCLWAIILIQGL